MIYDDSTTQEVYVYCVYIMLVCMPIYNVIQSYNNHNRNNICLMRQNLLVNKSIYLYDIKMYYILNL